MKKPEHVKILVIGDIMLDKYVVGEVNRISPEAPVGIVNVIEEYYTLGGCGHVCRNIKEMGAQVDCLASVGFDSYAQIVIEQLDNLEIGAYIHHGSKQTIVKERIISEPRQVQMLRIDREEIEDIKEKWPIKELELLLKNNYDIIIVSDYAKGMITHPLMYFLKKNTSTRIIVDPKPSNGIMYNGVYMITPNQKEWGSMRLSSAYQLNKISYYLVTKGKDGMELINNYSNQSWQIEADPVSIYNVSGAGDTAIAVMSVCLSMGWNELDSAYIANKCAGYVVTQPGTSAIPKDKFMKIISSYRNGDI